MSRLRELLDGYLSTRRALGFKLAAPAKTLDALVDWMDAAGELTIRHDLATGWVAQFSRGTVLERLNYIKQFAEHVACGKRPTRLSPIRTMECSVPYELTGLSGRSAHCGNWSRSRARTTCSSTSTWFTCISCLVTAKLPRRSANRHRGPARVRPQPSGTSDDVMVIDVDVLGKRFLVNRRSPGLRSSLSHLFRPERHEVVALSRVSFSMRRAKSWGSSGRAAPGRPRC